MDVKNPYDLKSWIRFWTLPKYFYFSIWCHKIQPQHFVQSTPDNSNPRELEPKAISLGFPSYIHCYFTLGNSNFPLTRSNFCFPSDHLYSILLSITRTMFKARDKLIKKNYRVLYSETVNFFTYQSCILCLYFLSVQCKYCPALYSNQVLLFKMLNYFFKNNISCFPWSEGCILLALYFFPIHEVSCRACHHHNLMWLFENRIFLISGFMLRNPELELPIARGLFQFPLKVRVIGSRLYVMQYSYAKIYNAQDEKKKTLM